MVGASNPRVRERGVGAVWGVASFGARLRGGCGWQNSCKGGVAVVVSSRLVSSPLGAVLYIIYLSIDRSIKIV